MAASHGTALDCAATATAPGQVEDASRNSVQSATKISLVCRARGVAPESAAHNGDGRIPVYDLTVDGEHEFFANGILVHNSGAFNLLAGMKAAGGLRVYSKSDKKSLLRLVLCSQETLSQVVIDDNRALFLSIQDPLSDGRLPEHGLRKLLDSLVLQFADLDPAECQETWGEPIAGYGKPASELMMQAEQARKLWNWISRQRADAHEVIVIQDSGNRLGKSIAFSIVDSLGLSRAEVIYDVAAPDEPLVDDPPNKFCYDLVKANRYG